jgi:hypothetical protein
MSIEQIPQNHLELNNIPKEELTSKVEECLVQTGALNTAIERSAQSDADHKIKFQIFLGLDNKNNQAATRETETNMVDLVSSVREQVEQLVNNLPDKNYILSDLSWSYEIPSKENPNEFVSKGSENILIKLSLS